MRTHGAPAGHGFKVSGVPIWDLIWFRVYGLGLSQSVRVDFFRALD